MVGAVGIEIASLIYKSHRTKALPTALGFNCCQLLPTKYARFQPCQKSRHFFDYGVLSGLSSMREGAELHSLHLQTPVISPLQVLHVRRYEAEGAI